MKLNNKIFIFGILLFFIMCKTNKTDNVCDKDIEKYMMYRSSQNIDSSLYYIDKVIKCTEDKDFYKFAKINFLISLNDYQKALSEFNAMKMDKNDDYVLVKAVLELKLNNENSEKTLREAYLKYKKINNDSNSVMYLIALENYFEGKSIALNDIKNQRIVYKDDAYTIQTLDVIEKLINDKSKEDVLYSLFNISLEQ